MQSRRWDEMMDDEAETSDDESEADKSGMALVPFEPDDHSTPGEGLRILPCPAKLPHDLEVGKKVVRPSVQRMACR